MTNNFNMKKFFFFIFILSLLINNCLFADNSKDAIAKQCFDNMEILENAVDTYTIKNKIKEEKKRQKEKFNSVMNSLYSQKGNNNTNKYHKRYGYGYSYSNNNSNRNRYRHTFINEHFPELFCFVFIPSIIIIIYLIYYFRKKRIEKYCENNNFVYEESPVAMTGNSEAFDILLTGDTSYFSNGMYKKRGDISINIVEFTATTRTGRHSSSKRFTLCQLYKENVQFPVFFVRDENVLLDSVGSMLGGQDIDFAEDKKFSDSFVLQGVNEEEVRRFFKSKVRNSFLKNHKRGNCYESKGRCFLLYRKGLVSINKKIEMMNTALKIFNDISSTGFKDNSLANDITRNPKYYGK